MVFIHGGAFFAGTPNPTFHGPHYFMDTGDIILVLMAYRLGALGMYVFKINTYLKCRKMKLFNKKRVFQSLKEFSLNML